MLQRREIVGERAGAVEVLQQPPLPGGRQIERHDQRGEKPDIAHADRGPSHAEVFRGFERERKALGICSLKVLAAERFDSRLHVFAGAAAAVAEHRTEIAVVRG